MATKLIDMKLPKQKKDDKDDVAPTSTEREQYPYGLKLNFEKEQIDKIKSLQNIADGAKVNIIASGKVTNISVDDLPESQKRRSVGIQIHGIEVADKVGFKESFKEATEK